MRRDAKGEVAASRTNVGDGVGGLQLHRVDEQIGALLAFTLTALEPADTKVAHDLSDFAAHVSLSASSIARLASSVQLGRGNDGCGDGRGDGRGRLRI